MSGWLGMIAHLYAWRRVPPPPAPLMDDPIRACLRDAVDRDEGARRTNLESYAARIEHLAAHVGSMASAVGEAVAPN